MDRAGDNQLRGVDGIDSSLDRTTTSVCRDTSKSLGSQQHSNPPIENTFESRETLSLEAVGITCDRVAAPCQKSCPETWNQSKSTSSSLAGGTNTMASQGPVTNAKSNGWNSLHNGGRRSNATDDQSFHLFANSFDTMSEADQCSYFSALDTNIGHASNHVHSSSLMSPPPYRRSNGPSGRGSRRTSLAASKEEVDIHLPFLKNGSDNEDQHGDYFSLANISPIKVTYESSSKDEEDFLKASSTSTKSGGRKEDEARQHAIFGGTNFGYPRQDHRFKSSHRVGSSSEFWNACVSNPLFVLRYSRRAFDACKYVLPAVRDPFQQYPDQFECDTSFETKIAARRVETAVVAFGGSRSAMQLPDATTSIFRLRGDARKKQVYAQKLQNRYYLSGSMLSWEVEENPPVYIGSSSEALSKTSDGRNVKATATRIDDSASLRADQNSTTGTRESSNGKPKYRCKLCGQLKQHHECPYRQSLHRSIGVMVYPAVNSFTAAEPGTVAPPLTKMNNFVSYDSHQNESPVPSYGSHTDSMVPKPNSVTPGTNSSTIGTKVNARAITDQVLGIGGYHSPQSTLSNNSDERPSIGRLNPSDSMVHPTSSGSDQPGTSSYRRPHKRSLSDVDHRQRENDDGIGVFVPSVRRFSVFASTVSLGPQHYRAVSEPTVSPEEVSSYQYPAIPLTFGERKRLSDTLFHLSKDMPSMTADCAHLLREARKNDEWDLAVAELLTQVIVSLYCGEGDACLDGLQQYLLLLGISC